MPPIEDCGPTTPMNTVHKQSGAYQWVLVGLLSLNFGVVFFERNSINVLMPFIQPDLQLSNTAIGELASALSFSWALSGLLVGRLSDALGRRKVILVVSAFIFSAASLMSGLATSFAMLLGARLVMGVAEGGVMPITQALVVAEVEPRRRGLAMGAAQNFGANLLGNFLAPVLLTSFALALGWRKAFSLCAVPGLIVGLLLWWIVREPKRERPTNSLEAAASKPSIAAALSHRNIWICVILSILLVAFIVVFATFMPNYLVQVRGMDQRTESWLMSLWGLPSMAYAFLIPGSSDYIGRRPVVIAMGAVSALIPLSILLTDAGSAVWPLFILFGLGAAVSGIFPLVMATIPSETVPAPMLGTVMGLTMGLGEIIGGVFSPTLAGWSADTFGADAILWILTAMSVVIAAFACFLQETAPARTGLRGRASESA